MKNRIVVLLFLLFAASVNAKAQELPEKWKSLFASRNFSENYNEDDGPTLEEGTKYEGSLVVYKNGSFKELEIDVVTLLGLSKSDFPLATSEGDLDKSELSAFVVNGNYFKDTGSSWGLVLVEGPLFAFVDFSALGEGVPYIQNRNEGRKNVGSLAIGYKKKMSAMLADHKELATKVAKKEKGYRFLDGTMYSIVHEYNEWVRENDEENYNRFVLKVQ